MERVAFSIYLITLVISPLLFGAVHAYAYSFVFTATLAGGLLLLVHNIRKDYRTGTSYFQYPVTRLNLLFYLVLGFLVLQVIPLPSFFVGLLSPEARYVKNQAAFLTDKSVFMSFAPYLYPVRMSIRMMLMNRQFLIGYLISFVFSLATFQYLLSVWHLKGAILGLITNQLLMLLYWQYLLIKKDFILWK